MHEEIKLGMVVRLASGGPNMTVMNVPESVGRPVGCVWFGRDKDGVWSMESELASFKPEGLVFVPLLVLT